MRNLIIVSLTLSLISFNCKEKLITTQEPEVEYYDITGKVFFDGSPLPDIEFKLDSLKCISDSSGFFRFDSIKSGNIRLMAEHAKYIVLDTLINLIKDVDLNFSLDLRNNTFYPCAIGNKWYYRDRSHQKLFVEITDTVKMNNKVYYKFVFSSLSSTDSVLSTSSSLRYFKSDTVFLYSCNEDQSLAIFNTALEDTFVYRICGYGTYSDHHGIVYQSDNNFVKIYYFLPGVLDAWSEVTFQKGIGITRKLAAFETLNLYDYEIMY